MLWNHAITHILTTLNSILDCPPEFDMATQAKIPPALAAIHNFIWMHDEEEIEDFADILNDAPDIDDFGELGNGPPAQAEQERATETWDTIAESMWQDYVQYRNCT